MRTCLQPRQGISPIMFRSICRLLEGKLRLNMAIAYHAEGSSETADYIRQIKESLHWQKRHSPEHNMCCILSWGKGRQGRRILKRKRTLSRYWLHHVAFSIFIGSLKRRTESFSGNNQNLEGTLLSIYPVWSRWADRWFSIKQHKPSLYLLFVHPHV